MKYFGGGVMEHGGISYTVRAGIERNHWIVVIPPGGVESVPKIVTGGREQAEALAHSMIDDWLRRHQWR
jgi:hypothetical protein